MLFAHRIAAAQTTDSSLGEANSMATNHPEHPLKRTVVATIRASLGDLALRRQKAVWAPSPDALRTMLQAKKFTSLSGAAESVGDLKSVVLHNMTLTNISSDFEIRTHRGRTHTHATIYGCMTPQTPCGVQHGVDPGWIARQHIVAHD